MVAFIGKEPGLDHKTRVGWEHIGAILDGRARQADFLEGPQPDLPEWATVDVSRVAVERLRDFGAPYLALALWRRLGLDAFFDEAIEEGREEIVWPVMACILTLARFCAPSSELQIAQFWYAKTALDDLLGAPKSMLKQFERQLLEEDWTRMENGVEVKVCAAPGGSPETFVLCRSAGRIEKDRAIRRRQVERMEVQWLLAKQALNKLKQATQRPMRPLRDGGKAERRVGRLVQRTPRAARFFDVTIEQRPDPDDPRKTRLRSASNATTNAPSGPTWPMAATCCARTGPKPIPNGCGTFTSA